MRFLRRIFAKHRILSLLTILSIAVQPFLNSLFQSHLSNFAFHNKVVFVEFLSMLPSWVRTTWLYLAVKSWRRNLVNSAPALLVRRLCRIPLRLRGAVFPSGNASREYIRMSLICTTNMCIAEICTLDYFPIQAGKQWWCGGHMLLQLLVNTRRTARSRRVCTRERKVSWDYPGACGLLLCLVGGAVSCP